MVSRNLQLFTVFIMTVFNTAVLAGNDAYNRISFSVAAEDDIANNLLVATLSAREQGENLRQLSDDVNKTMQWALSESNRVDSVKTQTLNYATSPRYEKGRQTGWQVSQSLKLSSTDSDSLTKLMGKLQQRLQLNSLSYQVTNDQREALQEKLTSEVLKKFSAKAERIVADMNSSGYRIVSLNIGYQNAQPPRPMLAMARNLEMADSVSAPGIQAGTQTVTVQVSAVIELEK